MTAQKWIDWSYENDYYGHMKQAAIAELKASLSEYLSHVKRGEEVVVTEHGHPVAKIIPLRGTEKGPERRRRLIREGIIEPGKTGRIPPEFLKPSTIKDPDGVVLKALLQDREEGW